MIYRVEFLNKFFILIFLLNTTICNAKEEVLFTVNNDPVTTIDLNQRLNYLSLLNNLDINIIDKNKFTDDLISIKLFDEYAIKKRFNINQEEILSYFDMIRINNQKKFEELISNKKLNEKIILNNIRYDLQRKNIIEYFLDDRINAINLIKNNHNIIDIYDIKLDYFIITNKYKNKIKINQNNLLDKDINSIKEFLNNSEILYKFSSKEIINLDRMNNEIKKNILDNKNIFIIYEDNYFMIGIVKKKLRKQIDLKYSFYQIKPKENINFNIINNDLINCSNIESKKSDKGLEITEYKGVHLEKLNINIFKNLSKVNQKLIIDSNNQKSLILLCDIDYNKKIAQEKIFDNKLQKLAKEIEYELVETWKKEFKFLISH